MGSEVISLPHNKDCVVLSVASRTTSALTAAAGTGICAAPAEAALVSASL